MATDARCAQDARLLTDALFTQLLDLAVGRAGKATHQRTL